jgi:hypothetical protein
MSNEKLVNTPSGVGGTFYCDSLQMEMNLMARAELTDEYISECIRYVCELPDDLKAAVCKSAKAFCLGLQTAYKKAITENDPDAYPADLVDGKFLEVTADTPESEIFRYLAPITLYLFEPDEPDVLAFFLWNQDVWNDYHGLSICVRAGKLLYVGECDYAPMWGPGQFVPCKDESRNFVSG